MTDVLALADDLVDVLAEEDPVNELLQGHPGFGHRLGDLDEATGQRLRRRARRIAREAARLDVDGQDRVTCGVLAAEADGVVTRIDARLVEHAMLDLTVSPVSRLLSVLPTVQLTGPEHEQDFLARLAGIPRFLAQAAERHREGVAAGRTPVGRGVRSALERLDAYLADADHDPLRKPVLGEAAADGRERLLRDVVRPAFATYREVLREEIARHGRPDDRPGLVWLPGGERTYAALAKMHTTTDRTPEQLHRTGLDVLARLDDEYREIGSEIFGARTAAEVRDRVRTDPALRWESAEELLTAARTAIRRAEQAAPEYFGRLPAHPCEVAPVPADQGPTAAAAFYVPGPLDGSRGGTYYANTYLATERDRTVSEAVAFHEAVPGHHFQITLAQEMTGLPKLRKVAGINSYIEGWALYCERLADEIGLYSGDLARLGMLAMDSMRAARLVVDTGLHAFGWSRQRAVDFLRARTVLAEVELQSEVDRYVETPGQALSYLVGRLEIERLRATAEREMGAAFDLRAFHDVVLGGGPLPMNVLSDVVSRWAVS
ncbi:DUF885 domain-containing protein [Saccharopolyspora taberi]|uniref:DUF885 domain-containing protein n=1 Tax=Saccharopolyspora taberi TaxID=60895 RepID=A0ABN3VCS5_9PSEU